MLCTANYNLEVVEATSLRIGLMKTTCIRNSINKIKICFTLNRYSKKFLLLIFFLC